MTGFLPLANTALNGPPVMLAALEASVAMAVRDAAGTLLTVAEARGRSNLAGWMDVFGDAAGFGVQFFATGSLLLDGLTTRTLIIIAAILVTDYVGTRFWTRFARRISAAP